MKLAVCKIRESLEKKLIEASQKMKTAIFHYSPGK